LVERTAGGDNIVQITISTSRPAKFFSFLWSFDGIFIVVCINKYTCLNKYLNWTT
ncbi:hypothetical protein KI387_036352, partial [Taxus chinensis]